MEEICCECKNGIIIGREAHIIRKQGLKEVVRTHFPTPDDEIISSASCGRDAYALYNSVVRIGHLLVSRWKWKIRFCCEHYCSLISQYRGNSLGFMVSLTVFPGGKLLMSPTATLLSSWTLRIWSVHCVPAIHARRAYRRRTLRPLNNEWNFHDLAIIRHSSALSRKRKRYCGYWVKDERKISRCFYSPARKVIKLSALKTVWCDRLAIHSNNAAGNVCMVIKRAGECKEELS